ncbi:MAG: HAD family hydrolase [Rhodobacter sp.]|nr:HAD family hydrolase [Rhodobacter sp.]
MLEALIFDVDGTLAETEELHRRAFNETFADHGLGWHWSRDDYRRLLQTTGGKERIARYLQKLGKDAGAVDIPALHRAKTKRYTDLMVQGEIALRDGIAPLIDEAHTAGVTVAIATTTSRPNVDALCLAAFGCAAPDLFGVIACGDEVRAKKPAPDVYVLALERLGLSASNAIALEDSANGLMSARGAGLDCLVSPSAYTDGDSFDGALRVVDSFSSIGGLEGITALSQNT